MLAPATHITQNGKAIQVSQLSNDTGSHVKVHYTEANGQKQATVVTVSPASKSRQELGWPRTSHPNLHAAAGAERLDAGRSAFFYKMRG